MGSLTRKIRNNGRVRGAQKTLSEMQERLQAALGVMTPEEAEAIIGEKPDVLNALLDGVKWATSIFWGAMRANGVKDKPNVIRMAGQNQIILMTLLLYAFAAGVKHGRERDG